MSISDFFPKVSQKIMLSNFNLGQNIIKLTKKEVFLAMDSMKVLRCWAVILTNFFQSEGGFKS